MKYFHNYKFLVWVAVTVFVSAQLVFDSAHAEDRSTKYTEAQIEELLKDEGYSSVERIDDGVFKLKVDGTAYLFFIQDDGDFQMYYGVSGLEVSFKQINEWNKNKRLSRAYIDSSNDPVIEADMLANGGVSRQNIAEFIRIFLQSAKEFQQFLDDL